MNASFGSLRPARCGSRRPAEYVPLAVDERGLHGVRRSAPLEASWEEIGTVTPVGPYGPKLAVSVAGRAPVIVDAHHLGSDPAAVAAVVSFFRDSPEQRHTLADGTVAMRTAESALRS